MIEGTDDNRIRDIEKRLYEIEKKLATGDVSDLYTDEKFKQLREELKALRAGINRILWTLGAVVIAAVGNFILKGGLNLPLN